MLESWAVALRLPVLAASPLSIPAKPAKLTKSQTSTTQPVRSLCYCSQLCRISRQGTGGASATLTSLKPGQWHMTV